MASEINTKLASEKWRSSLNGEVRFTGRIGLAPIGYSGVQAWTGLGKGTGCCRISCATRGALRATAASNAGAS
ncbi:MAG: hypothetical protein OEW90_13735, partial [Betaproteobacteria bacterium]|nr:hypothetical protein [Betaproteobacteria bacterium]